MKFYLRDENSDKVYWFKTTFKSDEDFDAFTYNERFEAFMDMMETTNGAPWSGVHNAEGDDGAWGYSSYEVEEFEIAIEMWLDFLKGEGYIEKKTVYVEESYKVFESIID